MSTTLHVGPAVFAWLHDISIKVENDPSLIAAAPGAVGHLGTTPVIVERGADWHTGRWEVREDGTAVAAGQIGADDETVIFLPGRGWIGYRATEVALEYTEGTMLLEERRPEHVWPWAYLPVPAFTDPAASSSFRITGLGGLT